MGKPEDETPEHREKRLAYNKKWNDEHKEEENRKRMELYNKWQKNPQISEHRIMRLEVLDRMGGKCVFCGEEDESALTIDHVLNDGAKERKEQRNVYLRLRNMAEIPTDRYQILCFNCNHKKRIWGDDPSKWPATMTVRERLDFVRKSAMTMAEARRAFLNGQAQEGHTARGVEEGVR
jgi:5-methylcytosine-specific restriction endonuclease McrA